MTPETDMNDDTRATPAQAVTAAIERIAAQWGGRMYAGPGGYVDIGRDIRAAAQAGPAEAQQPAKPPQAPSAAYIDELLCELDIDGGAYIDEGDRATVRRWLAGFGAQACPFCSANYGSKADAAAPKAAK